MEYSLYIRDLGPEVTDQLLLATFRAQFPQARTAKVITDAATGMSKGYAFVRFASQAEGLPALAMNGQFCGSSRMRVEESTTPRHGGALTAPPRHNPLSTLAFPMRTC